MIAKQQTDVGALDEERIAAMVAGDWTTVASLTADAYTHVETNGGVRSKAEFLALVDRPGFRFVRWTVEERRVRHYGDVAVITGTYRNVVSLPGAGEQPEKRARFLRVWVRESDDRWRNVAHQATRID